MPDRLIKSARIAWDDADPWGSGMILLGACCDLLTVIDGDLTGHRVPAEVGYRPHLGMDLASLVEDVDEDGFEYDYRFTDFVTECIADELGFGIMHNGEIDEPDLVASVPDWNAAPDALLHTITILHRYLNLVDAAGRSY